MDITFWDRTTPSPLTPYSGLPPKHNVTTELLDSNLTQGTIIQWKYYGPKTVQKPSKQTSLDPTWRTLVTGYCKYLLSLGGGACDDDDDDDDNDDDDDHDDGGGGDV